MNATTVNVNGALQFGGFLRTEALNVKGEMIASENSAIKATKAFNAEAGSRITADYINVTNGNHDATFYLKGDCKININNKSDIYTDHLVTDNKGAGQITLNDDNAIAVIKAKKFTNIGDNQIQALATSGNNATFLLQFTECYSGTIKENTFEDLDIAASYLDYDKALTTRLMAMSGLEILQQSSQLQNLTWLQKTRLQAMVCLLLASSQELTASSM